MTVRANYEVGFFVLVNVLSGCGGGEAKDASTAPVGGASSAAGTSSMTAGTSSATAGTSTTGGGGSGSGGPVDGVSPGQTGTPPEHTVTPCPIDAGVGKWVNVTPPGIPVNGAPANNGTGAFAIDPKNTANIYVGSDKLGVFKSTDCGATWARIDTGANADLLDNGGQWTMAIDHEFPNIVYTNSGYGANGMWQSTNGGVDWLQIFPKEVADFVPYGGFLERIRIDPTNSAHVLVTFHAGCTGQWAPDCAAESTDAGKSWKLLPWRPGNEEDAGQFLVDSKVWIYASLSGPIWRTADAGATWTEAYKGGSSDSLYVSKSGTLYQGTGSGILKSDDKGASWTMIPNSPGARDIVGDGTSLFTSTKECDAPPNCQPYWTASEADPTTWTRYSAPEGLVRGGWMIRYDEDHQLLYSSNEFGGFWRVRTK